MPSTRTADHDRGTRRGREDDASRPRSPTRCRPRHRRHAAARARRRAAPPSGSATLVKDPDARIGARAEALLYAAARAQLVEEAIEPLLERGHVGAARPVRRLLARLPGRRPRARGRSGPGRSTSSRPAGLTPDRTLLLTIDPRSAARARSRGEPADRLELRARRVLRPDRGRLRASWPPASPSGSGTIDATQPPGARARRPRSRRSRTYSE